MHGIGRAEIECPNAVQHQRRRLGDVGAGAMQEDERRADMDVEIEVFVIEEEDDATAR